MHTQLFLICKSSEDGNLDSLIFEDKKLGFGPDLLLFFTMRLTKSR
jgi:hypothetical protein